MKAKAPRTQAQANHQDAIAILQAAKRRCHDWDGLNILEAAIYRLNGITWGPSTVAGIHGWNAGVARV
jgi:hypothetical protein